MATQRSVANGGRAATTTTASSHPARARAWNATAPFAFGPGPRQARGRRGERHDERKGNTMRNFFRSRDRALLGAATASSGGISAPRRRLLTAAAGASLVSALDPALRAGAWAAGSDAPEKTEVKIGFIPLTDCASVVVASVMEFDKKYGIRIVPSKEASWAAVRDKLVNGELDAAHVLYGLVYGVHLGVGGPKKDMAVLATLNHNGQAITLSSQLKDKGAVDGPKLKALVDREKREYTFAQTFPTGTHAMWLYYWLATYGINPISDVKTIT